jgi:hypothetical protein
MRDAAPAAATPNHLTDDNRTHRLAKDAPE